MSKESFVPKDTGDSRIIMAGQQFGLFDRQVLGFESSLDTYEMIPRVEARTLLVEGLPPMELTVTSASELPPYHRMEFIAKLMDYRKNPARWDHIPPKRPKTPKHIPALGIELHPINREMPELLATVPETVLRVSEIGIEIKRGDTIYFGQFKIVPIIPISLAEDNDMDIPPGAAKIRVEMFHQIKPSPNTEKENIDYPRNEEECANLLATIVIGKEL